MSGHITRRNAFGATRRTWTQAISAGLIAAAAAFAWPTAQAQTLKWDMAEAFPSTSLAGQASGDFARLVKEKTNGRIDITVHYSGSLGIAERDLLTSVERGVVPLSSTILDKILTTMPVAAGQFLPFMAGSMHDGAAMWLAIRPYADTSLAKMNQTRLFESYGLPVGMWSKKPVTDIASLKTLKLRTNNPSTTKTFQNSGASPTFLAWGDVPPALATGVIDSVITSCESGISARFYEQMKVYTRLDIEIGVFLVHMHKPTLDGLPSDLKKAVLDSAAEASQLAARRVAARLEENTKTMKANGVNVVDTIPSQLREQLITAGGFLMDDWKKKVGNDTAGKILASFEQGRKK
jgi:TRAP-type C4-dicarboxylate transport system substrate-binding protein